MDGDRDPSPSRPRLQNLFNESCLKHPLNEYCRTQAMGKEEGVSYQMLRVEVDSRKGVAVRPASILSRTGRQKRKFLTIVGRFVNEDSGQVLPWMILLLLMFLGMSALVVDVGHAMVIQKQLQASVDAAALAAAEMLPNASYSTMGTTYSAAAGKSNAYNGVSVGTPTITPLCLHTVSGWGISCTSTSPNAVSVTETATIPTFFAGVLGIKTMTVSAKSTASKGSKPLPYNVAIVLDTTGSMDNNDSNCGATQLECATQAFQYLLQGLDPNLDSISLFTFPGVTTTSAANDYNCSGNGPQDGPYTFPSKTATSLSSMPYTTTSGWGWNQTTTTQQMTYQIVGYSNDYRTSNTASTLSSSSNLAVAVGSGRCAGIQTSNDYNTYYAATIYAAQASLIAQQAARPGSGNAMIILSDGNATAMNNGYFQDFVTSSSQSTTWADSSGNYPNSNGGGSWVGECGQGVDAANYASNYVDANGKKDGTVVFTIAYGSPTTSTSGGRYGNGGNCSTDIGGGPHPGITPCQAMQQMSSGWNSTPQDKSHFFSDYYAPGGDSGCQAADANNTITSLNAIVNAILGDLQGARLIPNSTY